MLGFVPDKRSPLTGGHGGVRVQPQTLCTTEQKQWAKHRDKEKNAMGKAQSLAFKMETERERDRERYMTRINE